MTALKGNAVLVLSLPHHYVLFSLRMIQRRIPHFLLVGSLVFSSYFNVMFQIFCYLCVCLRISLDAFQYQIFLKLCNAALSYLFKENHAILLHSMFQGNAVYELEKRLNLYCITFFENDYSLSIQECFYIITEQVMF